MGAVTRLVVTGLGALALAGCSHSEAFENPDRRVDGPFRPGAPLRLTYNAGTDRAASIVPDGGGVLFAFQRTGTNDADQCIGSLPPAGGTATEWCPRSAGSRDSTDRLDEPVTYDAATLLYARASRPIGAVADQWRYLGTAPLAAPDAYTVRVRFPFTASSGRQHQKPGFSVSLGDGRIAYLALRDASASPDATGEGARLVELGVEAAIATLASEAAPEPVPGTDRATSIARGAAPGELLYTLPGDGRVYRRRADGTVDVLHQFASVAREPSLAGDRLVAVVGGAVALWYEGVPPQQTAQVDFGGPLVLVDLATGEETTISAPDASYRRPSIAPDGTYVVAQGAATPSDLFRLELP